MKSEQSKSITEMMVVGSGETDDPREGYRIFERDKLFSLAEMTELFRNSLNLIDDNFECVERNVREGDFEKAVGGIDRLQGLLPEEFVQSTRLAHKIRVKIHLWKGQLTSVQRVLVEQQLPSLKEALENEFNRVMFLCLAASEQGYFADKDQFGEIAPMKFREIAGDIDEAYKCLGVGRYTASVFHCMRMLEFGVHRLARHFEIDLQVEVVDNKTHKPTGDKRDQEWNTLCQQILKKIKNMPAPTEPEQEIKLRFEDLAIHLSNVRAERNAVMHARYATTKRFTSKKAENVLEETKNFISELALVLPE